MKLSKFASVSQIIIGAVFLFSTASDIQLGFGLFFITQGMVNYAVSKKME